jgi:hypothetical protein
VQQIHDALMVLLRREMYRRALSIRILRLYLPESTSHGLQAEREQSGNRKPFDSSPIGHDFPSNPRNHTLPSASEVTVSGGRLQVDCCRAPASQPILEMTAKKGSSAQKSA